jgi:hypothetical protein
MSSVWARVCLYSSAFCVSTCIFAIVKQVNCTLVLGKQTNSAPSGSGCWCPCAGCVGVLRLREIMRGMLMPGGVWIWQTSAAACGMARMPPARTLIRLGTKIFSVRY